MWTLTELLCGDGYVGSTWIVHYVVSIQYALHFIIKFALCHYYFQSYGGFVTAHAIGDDRDIFNCGIAVAPVTDWRYYGKNMRSVVLKKVQLE